MYVKRNSSIGADFHVDFYKKNIKGNIKLHVEKGQVTENQK